MVSCQRFNIAIFSPLVRSFSSARAKGVSKLPAGFCLASIRFNDPNFMHFPPIARFALWQMIHGEIVRASASYMKIVMLNPSLLLHHFENK